MGKLMSKGNFNGRDDYEHQIKIAQLTDEMREVIFDGYFNPNKESSVSSMRASMYAFNHILIFKNIREKQYRRFWSQIIDYCKVAEYPKAKAVFEELLPNDLQEDQMLKEFAKLSKRFG